MPERVMVITGASSGIGEATARLAVSEGFRLVLGARRLERLEELAGELGGPERARALRCDVTEWADQEALAAAALDAFGAIVSVGIEDFNRLPQLRQPLVALQHVVAVAGALDSVQVRGQRQAPPPHL